MCGVACVVGLAMIKPVLGCGCGCGLEREASGDLERAKPRSRTLLCSVHCACLAPDPVRTRDSRPDPDAGAGRCRCRRRRRCRAVTSIPFHAMSRTPRLTLGRRLLLGPACTRCTRRLCATLSLLPPSFIISCSQRTASGPPSHQDQDQTRPDPIYLGNLTLKSLRRSLPLQMYTSMRI